MRRMAQRPRGGSGNNPYLKPNRYAREYTVLIEPFNIAKKIMLVRDVFALQVQICFGGGLSLSKRLLFA